ncbi:MAG TPA: phosphopantetheine-binding protein, partial [Kofleriaceae bacterium]
LGMAPHELALEQTLSEVGLDSMLAVELRRRLAAATAVALPATLAFDYPSASAIAGLLLEELGLDDRRANPSGTVAAGRIALGAGGMLPAGAPRDGLATAASVHELSAELDALLGVVGLES